MSLNLAEGTFQVTELCNESLSALNSADNMP